MVYEADIERKHRKIATAAGWFTDKIMRTSMNSFPDRFYAWGKNRCPCCGQGRIVLMEWKRGSASPTEQQKLRHKQLQAAGVEVHVVRSVEEANDILRLGDTQLSFDL